MRTEFLSNQELNPKYNAATPTVSMNPCARMLVQRFRPVSKYADPRINPATPESMIRDIADLLSKRGKAPDDPKPDQRGFDIAGDLLRTFRQRSGRPEPGRHRVDDELRESNSQRCCSERDKNNASPGARTFEASSRNGLLGTSADAEANLSGSEATRPELP